MHSNKVIVRAYIRDVAYSYMAGDLPKIIRRWSKSDPMDRSEVANYLKQHRDNDLLIKYELYQYEGEWE